MGAFSLPPDEPPLNYSRGILRRGARGYRARRKMTDTWIGRNLGGVPSAPPAPLRVLLIEDSESDAMLILAELRRAGFDPSHGLVWSAEALAEALKAGPWDLLISDCNMPCFSGLDALLMVKERGLDLPFIMVSGAMGEEPAVEAMKAGAHDY